MQTIHVSEIYIKASPQAIWDAITTPEWTARYGYRGPAHYDLRPGGKYLAKATKQMRDYGMAEDIIDGEVIEASPPHKLVQTYRFLFSEANKQEGFTKLTWEIQETASGFCRLSVTHELGSAKIMAAAVVTPFSESGTGGWNWILSDLKSLLETGKTMAG